MKLRLSFAVLALSMSSLLSAQEAATATAAPATTAPAEAAVATDAAAPAAAPAPVDPLAATIALLTEVGKATPGNAEAGAAKSAACAACHGLDGNSADPQYPKLAGQHEAYIARQLAVFKTGARPNPIMLGFAATLSVQDMRDIGAHFAKQKIQAGVADESKIVDELSPNKGQRIVDVGARIFRGGIVERGVPACMGCHGPSGRGVPGPTYPSIGGQHSNYTTAVLKLFKATPANSPALKDPNYATMADIAGRLTDEEILAVSSFAEGLHTRAAAAQR